MKKIMLIAAGALIFGATATFAQDTTRRTSPVTPQTQTPQRSGQEQDDMKGWTRVQSAEIPSSLRTTLGGSQYAGWDQSTVYRNEAGDHYMVKIEGDNPRTVYFDRDGKEVSKPKHKDKDNDN